VSPRLAFLLGLLSAAWLHGHAAAQLPGPLDAAEFAQRRHTHWAWQPLRVPTPPPGAAHPVDAFLDTRLTAAGLARAPAAPPHTQLRRLWFDLVGLPPPPAAVQRFVADPSDVAWARQVDALLASPHYAERQARHWLDLVRYAETLGHESDFEIPNAWRYRDYVIRAYDQDLPHDQFVREHLAGDLLPAPRRDAEGNNESVQATAAFWFAEQTHSPVDAGQHQADRIDNQLDVVGKAVLGLTIACARCHDHKFDAIRASDYYALAGFVQSSRYVQAPLRPVEVHGADYQRALAAQRTLASAWGEAATGEAWEVVRGDSRWFERPRPEAPPDEPPGEPSSTDWNPAAELPELRPHEWLLASAYGWGTNWFVTNDGFGGAPWDGPFCPDPAATNPQLFVLPGKFWNSAIAGPARDGVLSTDTFPIEQRYLHVRTAGRGGRLKVIVDGFHLVRDPIYGSLHRTVDDTNAHWVTFDLQRWRGKPAYLQCLDQRTPDLADPHRERSQHAADAWLAVQSVVLSPHADAPRCGDSVPLPPPGGTTLPSEVGLALAALRAAVDALPVSPTLPAMADGTGHDGHVFVRGDHKRPGAPAPRRFLQALAGDTPLPTGPGSGRLALADALLAADNPLLARVFVNRVWHHLFGRGLVRTVDNLGALGEPPSHPELLDWLAGSAITNGWSTKHVVRLLVTSAAYRQDSRRRDDAERIDPNNVLLHRQNVRRLDAEVVRDSLLAQSGRLDPRRFGPPIDLPLDTLIDARGRPPRSGPLDGDGRRSIYLAVRRNFLSPFLLAFDLPTPFATVGARSVSNVPAQALALANDPFVHAECARWAGQLQRERPAGAVEARLMLAYLQVFGRAPDAEEQALCRGLLASSDGDGDSDWADLLHALVNTTEFLYLR
jgi:cytochrome c553